MLLLLLLLVFLVVVVVVVGVVAVVGFEKTSRRCRGVCFENRRDEYFEIGRRDDVVLRSDDATTLS